MERTLIRDSREKVGQEIKISAWVQVRRDHGGLIFLELRDRSGLIQAVVNQKVSSEAYEEAGRVRGEFVVEAVGKVNKRPDNLVNQDMDLGEIELEVSKLSVLSPAEPLPFDLESEDINLDTYLDHQPLLLRSPKNMAVFRVQAAIVASFHQFLQSQGFTQFQAPKIVAQAAEGGANVFRMDYFGHQAYLAQSPQLYKQILTGVFERAYTVTSVYRAEPHATTRHLNEYVSLDYEMAFIRDHTDVMAMLRNWLAALCEELIENYQSEFKQLEAEIPKVPKEIPTFTLKQAQEDILKKEFDIDAKGAPDLDPEHEKLICQHATEKLGSDFVFITHYPTSKRPFYTYPDENDPEVTKSFDLLFRGVEITTGGQRINDYQQQLQNIEKWGFDQKNFSFFLEALKYGMPPEGGCATGLERLTQKLLGLANVKQSALFPRDMGRIDLPLSKLKLEDEGGGEKQDGQ